MASGQLPAAGAYSAADWRLIQWTEAYKQWVAGRNQWRLKLKAQPRRQAAVSDNLKSYHISPATIWWLCIKIQMKTFSEKQLLPNTGLAITFITYQNTTWQDMWQTSNIYLNT